MTIPWEPSDPCRWAELGLHDPDPDGRFPDRGTAADLLAYALVPPGSDDPVTGIVDGVRIEMVALADALGEREANVSDALHLLARRLEVAVVLLDRIDNRVPPPPGEEEESPGGGDARETERPPE